VRRGDGTKSERTYWCAELAWIDHDGTPTKKIIQRTSKGAAQTALARLKDEIRSRTLVSGADATISVQDVMENYLDDVALGVRANTIETYRTIVAHHVVPHLGRRRANSLRRTGVVGWLNDLEANEVGDRLRQVAYRLLKAAVGPYVANLPPREHPLPRGKGPKSDAPPINVWSADEVGKFLAAAAGDRYYAVYVLALSAGLRQGEILALRWRDIGSDKKQKVTRVVPMILFSPQNRVVPSA
jgi:integrase